MSKKTDFTIFWNSVDGQDEVKGIYLYGLFRSHDIPDVGKRICDLWTGEHGEVQSATIDSALGSVLSVSLKLDEIPLDTNWFIKLEASLSTLIDYGALVTWAGGEDGSCYPEVLDPDSDVGNVYAAKAVATGFMCNDKNGGKFECLSNAQLSCLWKCAQLD